MPVALWKVKFWRVVELLPKLWLKILAKNVFGSKKMGAEVVEKFPMATISVLLLE